MLFPAEEIELDSFSSGESNVGTSIEVGNPMWLMTSDLCEEFSQSLNGTLNLNNNHDENGVDDGSEGI